MVSNDCHFVMLTEDKCFFPEILYLILQGNKLAICWVISSSVLARGLFAFESRWYISIRTGRNATYSSTSSEDCIKKVAVMIFFVSDSYRVLQYGHLEWTNFLLNSLCLNTPRKYVL